ncbi:MAG: NAD(P)/FAD-dependent oxidoreductase [Chitinophagales bacterium]|nr:NAD(P)/FAD-dependent oxidoreductase [Chitinophagaceae bacterium]MCB9064242.1 NAD(P)/FAD-dependent oxidoreductase [Chitinophagales bacterium]
MEVKKIETEAIIIGGGPAGAGTSLYLTDKGIKHVIIEREQFPRDKVCGDACSGKTAFVLRKLHPEWLQEIYSEEQQFMPSHGITFVAPNGKPLNIPFGPSKVAGETAPGFTATRLVFDNYLFERLPSQYNEIYQEADVKEIIRNESGVKVTFTQGAQTIEVSAPVIVGADGDKSIVRKQLLNDNISDKSKAIGLRAYYEGITGLHEKNFIELHFLKEVLPGYMWIFPLPNGMANVGIGILSERIRDKKINLREKMLYAIENNPNISPRFKNAKLHGKILGWGLPLGAENRPVSGDRFLLTGDAGSLVDPFSGEGIGNALYSGMLAADAIAGALENQQFDAEFLKNAYDKPLYRRLGNELKISLALQKLSRFPWLFNFVVNKAEKSASLSDTISCMFTDLDLRDRLRKPSFYLKILMNK